MTSPCISPPSIRVTSAGKKSRRRSSTTNGKFTGNRPGHRQARAVIEKITSGKMEKFYEENCLYEQHFIKDEGVTIKELVDQTIAKVGENVTIRRFSRFKVGEMDGSASSAPPSADATAPVPSVSGLIYPIQISP